MNGLHFVAYTAYRCETDGADLDSILSLYFDDSSQIRSRTEDEGCLSDGSLTKAGILAAVEFARENDWLTRSVPEQLEDFYDVTELVDTCAENQRGGIPNPQIPSGFSEYESEHRKFKSHPTRYVDTRAKDYPNGSRVELDYRSQDPSGPFEMEPDRASAVVRLKDLGREFTFRRGWDEAV